MGGSKLSRARAPAPVWFQPSTQLRSFPVSCFGMHSRSLHESAPVLFQQRKSQPPLSLRKRRKAQAERWVEADDDDKLEVDYETAVDREEVAPRQMPVVISSVPAARSESRTTFKKREDEISRMEESLRALMSEQDNRSEEETQFLRDKENEWREWQTQKRQKRAATMQDIDKEEIELEFSRSEANFDIGVEEDEQLQQQKQQKLAKSQVERWAHAEPADEGVVNFKSNAKDRKQERRMLVIAKAVRVHLRAALGSGRATKRRDDLAFLSTSVFITQVIMSKDVGHAEVLWTPMNAGSAGELKTEVDRIEKALDAIKGALRNVLAVELNIRRCPEITLRVDPAWLASVRAEAAFEKMKEQRAMWAAAGYRREEEGDEGHGLPQGLPAHAPVHAAPPAAAAKEKHFSQDEIEYMEAVLARADTDADAAAEADDDAHGRRFVSFISLLVLKQLACWYSNI